MMEDQSFIPKSVKQYKFLALEHCESYYCNFSATICSNSEVNCGSCDEDMFTCHYNNVTCVTSCLDTNISTCNTTWNCSVNFECQEHEILSSAMEGVVYFMYSIIFVFALIGNGTVCYIVSVSQRMRTVTNFFIVNLALGDILMTVFCIPFSFVSILILHYWPFGGAMCSIVSTMQAITVFVSAYTLVAITLERYVALLYPLKPRMTKPQSKIIIVCVWAVAIATALPVAVVTDLAAPDAYYESCNEYVCMEVWADPLDRYRYSISLMVFQYFFPLSVLIVCYSRIAMVVWGNRVPGEEGNNSGQRMARSKRKVIKMLVTVVLVFTLCWLPFNMLQVIADNYEGVWDWPHISYIWTACHWLAMSHTCYNPFIYCWMNQNFRRGLFLMLDKIPGIRRCMRTNVEEKQLRRQTTLSTYASMRVTTNVRNKSSPLIQNKPPVKQEEPREMTVMQHYKRKSSVEQVKEQSV